MATPPTFTDGDVLYASQMNAVGLWKITPTSVTNGSLSGAKVTIGNAVTSCTISGVFSADYDNYRIVLQGSNPSLQNSFMLQFGSTATGYYGALPYYLYSGTAGVLYQNNATAGYFGLNQNGDTNAISIADICNPYLAKWTSVTGQFTGRGYSGTTSFWLQNTTSYTDLKILTDGAGTMTGGTVMIYGYRQG